MVIAMVMVIDMVMVMVMVIIMVIDMVINQYQHIQLPIPILKSIIPRPKYRYMALSFSIPRGLHCVLLSGNSEKVLKWSEYD